MPDDLYHRDILAWSTAQAERLRRVAAGGRVNDLDWATVIEEVGSVGRGEAQAVDVLLRQAMVHALNIAAWPGHSAARKWRNAITVLLVGATRRFSPSMAQYLDVPDIHAAARRQVLDLDMRALPEATDLPPAERLDESLGAEALIARLAPR
ncbi:DUF29 family protein [Dankookia sp. GCM10030260]|uniref:DUF29 family protein n=1 Tax=Dankookia sp. GCM10030260 TaxID=3273390 RepID=UPI00361C9510